MPYLTMDQLPRIPRQLALRLAVLVSCYNGYIECFEVQPAVRELQYIES